MNETKELLRRGAALQKAARGLLDEHTRARQAVRDALAPLTAGLAEEELAGMPVALLRDATVGRVRVEALEAAGLLTVADVRRRTEYELVALPGIGRESAGRIATAAARLHEAAAESVAVRLDVDARDERGTALVVALARLRAAGPDLPKACAAALRVTDLYRPLLREAVPAGNRLRMLLAGAERRGRARAAVAELAAALEADAETGLLLAQATADLLRSWDPDAAWIDFEVSAADHYGLLAETVALPADVEASRGGLPEDVVERVLRQPLDDSRRRVSLRGYQDFAARFALVQRRVIIGDEMGLGKSIEAIAVLAHLAARGETHFLVACPASVLVNWLREVESRSTLAVHRLHGPGRGEACDGWRAEGGVAVTTLDTLRLLGDPRPVAALVVDEAHYVKNPKTRRAERVAAWSAEAGRVLYLTGTPLENRLGEFRELATRLRPDLRLPDEGAPGSGTAGFRKAVAPVYLRRNQRDVLAELPALVRVDEWTEFTADDEEHYRAAVESGNFMAMRRAAYRAGEKSAKLIRLLEITEEAAAHGRKVAVFSQFLDTLGSVAAALGERVTGTLTGAQSPEARQDLVDAFRAAKSPAVLLSQIQAGGVGLNLQAASVVVICEPQVKPSLETQAVARCHRMGQVRPVTAHRLLTAEGVDQRLVATLTRKQQIFDDYAGRSELAESTAAATDTTDLALTRQIVEEEQLRLISG